MNTEKCNDCTWLYNGSCTCDGLKPCIAAKVEEKVNSFESVITSDLFDEIIDE